MKPNACVTAALAVACLAGGAPAFAQQWPDKPVRILVPFPPGGGTDIQARLLSKVFQQDLGQPFVIDNRTGALSPAGPLVKVGAPVCIVFVP